jgi:hypothetical protein
MRWFVRRLTAVVAVALVPMAAVTVATPEVSSSELCLLPGFSNEVEAEECKPPPPPPPGEALAAICAAVGAAAPSSAAVGAVGQPGNGIPVFRRRHAICCGNAQIGG